MAEPFRPRQPIKASFLQRILGRKVRQNAVPEIVNHLAQAKKITDVSPSVLGQIYAEYQVGSLPGFSQEMEKLYTDFVRHCLADKLVTETELKELSYLKRLFGLTDETVRKIHEEVSGVVYGAAVDSVLRDGKISQEEKEFLTQLQTELCLPNDTAERILQESSKSFVTQRIERAIADQRLSPGEDEEITAIARNLDITVNYDEHTKNTLDLYRLYWLIENAEIPAIYTDITLQRGEKCYQQRQVAWNELRTVTKRINYSGPTARIRLAKGISWRVGSVSVNRVSQDIMTQIDSGTAYLTSKRLIFVGNKKNSTIRLNKILDFSPYKDGIEITKDSGKSPFLSFKDDVDLFALVLRRLLRDAA